MDDAKKINSCLAACLTILVKKKMLAEEQIAQFLEEKDLDALFDSLNKVFQEIEQE